MGRKLSPAEAAAFARDGTSLPGQKADASSSHGSELQSRIAEVLGFSVADFLDRSDFGNGTQDTSHAGQTAEMALTRDCLDLIEAFGRVEDAEERQRILKMVRDAAHMNKLKEP